MPDYLYSAETLRQAIDQIDLQLIELLRQRTALAQKIGKLKDPKHVFCRPQREADILRRLYRSDLDLLPKMVPIRFWREMISVLTWMQKPFSIFVTEALWDITRDYYGSWIALKVFAHPDHVLDQLIDQSGLTTEHWKIGVLPYPDPEDQGWWRRLISHPSLKVIARLPFEGYGNARAPHQEGLAVTYFTPEEGSGEDRTIMLLQTDQPLSQEEVMELLNHSVEKIFPLRGEIFWIEVAGFFTEEETLLAENDRVQGRWIVGHYAVTPHMRSLSA